LEADPDQDHRRHAEQARVDFGRRITRCSELSVATGWRFPSATLDMT